MENKEIKRQNLLFFLGLFSLVIMVGSLTFAFFNYEFSGNDANYVKLGNIEFNSNYSQVILNNVFPISSSDVATSNRVETVVVTIKGRTEYDDGIEYLVSFTEAHCVLSNKVVPVSIDVTTNGLGNSDNNYFTNRGGSTAINKVLVQDKLLSEDRIIIGYIPTGTNYVDGSITIKAYIDEDDVFITDTYNGHEDDDYATTSLEVDNRVVLTTSEWSSLKSNPISFKVRVEAQSGIWVNEPQDFYDLIEGKATTAPSYVKGYTATVINNNNATFTTQDTVETNNNKQEVYYYTGSDAVTNGNVLFGGYCWQIVRTTDNGGIRLLYNGVAESNKCMDSRSNNTYRDINSYRGDTGWYRDAFYLYGDSYDYDVDTGKFRLINPESNTRKWTKTTYESFLGKYSCRNQTGTNCDFVDYIGPEYLKKGTVEYIRYEIADVIKYSMMGQVLFNAMEPIASAGYMFNRIYYFYEGITEDAIYGKNVEYSNGNYLVIETTSGVASSNTTLDQYHHYSCGTLDNNDAPETTCEIVRYYFYINNSGDSYYIELSNGEKVEDALKNMLNYKQSGDITDANINVISSNIKSYLEVWYDKNLQSYENYLDEDAVYCNDRSILDLGGWDSDGEFLENPLKFHNFNENLNLACVNVTDRFSKGNIKAKIRNPIGLITWPERLLMTRDYAAKDNYSYGYFTISPRVFYASGTNIFTIYNTNKVNKVDVVAYNASTGVRAAITLKPGTVILGGSGLDTDPYQVGPLVTVTN